jgi:hypothetical protein
MGKGSNPRPFEVPKEEFRNNWDKIFGKKDPKEDKPQPPSQKDAK